MSSGFSLDAQIDEVEALVEFEQSSYQASKGERSLDAIENKISTISDNDPVLIMQSAIPVASAEFSIVKDQLNNFVENSTILMSVLDDVGKVHPFIQAALVVFKAGIQLEITRRQNDQKVLALNITMCDMMSVLRLLKKVTSPKELDGLTIEKRLQGRMRLIIDSMRSCAKLCDSYQKRHVAIKFLTSTKWRQRFTDLAEQFVAHQSAIQFDLQLYISGEVTNTNEMLSTLSKNVTSMSCMMKMVFDRMQSPEERELANFIQNKGGVATSPDDKLLQDVMKNFQQQRKDDKTPTRGAVSEKMPTKGSPGSDFPADLAQFKKELNKEIGDILEENSEVFERTFRAMEISLKEVKGTIVHEGDRIIKTILDGVNRGAQERIKDRDLYHVWQEMGWRGSVKATHLVMAINDHFSAKWNNAINAVHVTANEANPPTEDLSDIALIAQQTIPVTPAEDLWSLRYITVHRSQPLIEAIDDDGSSFITVNEVNKFTTSRPKDWSLPRWIAYWTIGFEMTTQWYYRRIRRLFSLLSESSKDVLPANRRVVSQFLDSWSIHATERLLAGCQDVSDWDRMDWAHDSRFLKFKPWVLKNERSMNKILRRLVYFIDQDNTLNIVTGGGRPETYVMPLLYLLMERGHTVMKRAHDVVLHREELYIIEYSMYSVHSAIRDRVEKLQDIYKLQNINKEEKLQTVFFGLYAYTFEQPKKGEFWTQDPDEYDTIPEEPPSDSDIPEPELFYHDKPQIEELDLDAGLTKNSDPESLYSNTNQEEPVPMTQASQSLVGAWSGTYRYRLDASGPTDGLVSFSITQHTSDDRFHCSGVDTWGPFTVNGHVNGEHIIFLKEYAEPQNGEKVSWRYKGLLNKERDEISGKWGLPSSDDGEALVSDEDRGDDAQTEPGEQQGAIKEQQEGETVGDTPPTINIEAATLEEKADEDMMSEEFVPETGSPLADVSTDTMETWIPYGTFVLYRRPVHYAFCRPPDEEFQENKPRALWRLVQNAARYWFKMRHLTWEGIRERRDKRQTYLELWRKKKAEYDTFTDPADKSKWDALVCAVHPDDLQLWRKIAQFKDRREAVHTNICDGCQTPLELHSSRIVCIECSEGEFFDTIDLCPNCQTLAENVCRKKDNKNHEPSHPMVQLRRVLLRIEINSVMSHAKSRLNGLSDEEVKYCTHCRTELPERPYWYCTQCKDDTFVCIKCNDLAEKQKPWLLRRKAAPEQAHDRLHTMVLKPQAVGKSDPPGGPGLSIDERLAKLEAKLDKQVEQTRAFEASVAVRLHMLEELFDKQMEQNRKLQELLQRVHT